MGAYSCVVPLLRSAPRFRVLHALRIKGFAKVEVLSELAVLHETDVESHLTELQAAELALYREQRALWQLSPKGREVHVVELHVDVSRPGFRDVLHGEYEPFLALNDRFKQLCGDWQLRDGQPNDHGDPVYDRNVIARLRELHGEAHPIVASIGDNLERFSGYAPRLGSSADKVVAGEHKMFTGVMCGSYHDVWMELHEDLILSQGIDRAKEGSF